MKKHLLILWSLLLTLAPLGCLAQEEPSVPTQTLKVAGLAEKVMVRRDERGIPFIEAASDADLYFAQGWATASDRLWQMDLLRRVARGELSEIFGRTTLEDDKRWRKYNFASVAEQTLARLAPEARAALEAYARGVNAFIATRNQDLLPPEFKILQYRPREWKPEDSVVIGKILAEGLSSTYRFDLVRQTLQSLPADKQADFFNPTSPHDVLLVGKDDDKAQKDGAKRTARGAMAKLNRSIFDVLAKDEEVRRRSLERVGLYAEDLLASNNWVVSGKHTADGKPLLANDPHLPASVPSIWHLVHLSAPNIRVAGVTAPGAPGVIIGHNTEIAWGMTNVGPDVQDLYLEQFDSNNPRRYKTPSGWQEAQIRREEIKVRKSPVSPETVSEQLEIVSTRNGVIFVEDADKRYALKWTAFDPANNEFEVFYSLNRAKNWNEFKSALKLWGGAMQNFVYADTTGNIGWIAAGRVPLRKTGNGSLPYDGATDDGEWTGLVPFEELPQLYNPPNGIIVTANQRTIGANYKFQEIARDFASPFRARRIYDLLQANPRLTIENFNDVQRDTFDIAVSRFAREVVNQKAASEETLKLFGGWDGRMNADSRAALLAAEMRKAFRQKVMAANLPAPAVSFYHVSESAFLDRIITEKPKTWLPREFVSYADLLRASEKDARQALSGKFGADESKWTWGEANKIRFNHPLAAVPFIGGQFAIEALPLNGSGGAPNVGGNVSMRFIAAPGNWDASRQGIMLGESGIPGNVHWRDQLENWYKGITPIFPFSQTAVRNAAKEKLLLEPAK